jgi:hypothetical protein
MKLNSEITEAPFALTSKNTKMLTTKEARIAPLPMMPINDFDIDFLPNPLIRNPSRGKSGIK